MRMKSSYVIALGIIGATALFLLVLWVVNRGGHTALSLIHI